MSMSTVASLVVVIRRRVDVSWTVARILGIEETSLDTHSLQRVYVVRKQRAYSDVAGVQDVLSERFNSISFFFLSSTNNLGSHFHLGLPCKVISV